MAEKKSSSVDKGKKFTHFQVNLERLARTYRLEVHVMDVRVGRGKREIWSEGYARDAFNILEFRTRGAKTYMDTIRLTLDACDRRGFIPRDYRIWEGNKWGPWNAVVGYPKEKTAG